MTNEFLKVTRVGYLHYELFQVWYIHLAACQERE
jgi:hypothetical protein